MSGNFANFYTILFILVRGSVVIKKIKFIIIEFAGVLKFRFLFYLLINITFI